MRNKYRVGYLDKDEQICLIDVWADSPAAAAALVVDAIQIIWVHWCV